MTTRATYQFITKQNNSTVYIHHDGYPLGAAIYFYNMLNRPTYSGDNLAEFIRANEYAEITESHQHHGDTNYQYTVTGTGYEATLKACKVYSRANPHEFYNGPLLYFIDQNSELIKEYSPFQLCGIGYIPGYYNRESAKRKLSSDLSLLEIWNGKFNGSANWHSLVGQAKKVLKYFPELAEMDVNNFLGNYFKKNLVNS